MESKIGLPLQMNISLVHILFSYRQITEEKNQNHDRAKDKKQPIRTDDIDDEFNRYFVISVKVLKTAMNRKIDRYLIYILSY